MERIKLEALYEKPSSPPFCYQLVVFHKPKGVSQREGDKSCAFFLFLKKQSALFPLMSKRPTLLVLKSLKRDGKKALRSTLGVRQLFLFWLENNVNCAEQSCFFYERSLRSWPSTAEERSRPHNTLFSKSEQKLSPRQLETAASTPKREENKNKTGGTLMDKSIISSRYTGITFPFLPDKQSEPLCDERML